MGNGVIPKLYQQYYIEKDDERRMLFEKVVLFCNPEKGLYPGSFVHITPSLYISDMTYIDSDKRISKFFKDEHVLNYIESQKNYEQRSILRGIQADYSGDLPIEETSYSILFSFYAGFISQSCKKYLKPDGILLCNNSHGDASLAYVDKEYELIGVVKRNGNQFSINEKDLHTYFMKKDGSPIDRAKVEETMIGEKFTHTGYAYLFKYTPSSLFL